MYEMNPITLSFPGDEEHRFYEDYVQKSIKHVRVAALLGVFLYTIFGILDALVFPEGLAKVWFIRFAILCPSAFTLYCLTYSSYYKKFMQGINSFVILIGGIGFVAMMVISTSLGNYLYYGGLMLLVIYSYTFVRSRFVYATLTSWTIVLAYEVVAIWINPTPIKILISNNFFFISANIVGMFACYFMELYVRRDFVQRKLLELEEEKSEKLLLNILPKEIAERLKQGQDNANVVYSKIIVDKFPDVTVLFADIVGFTSISSRISPESLVVFLNELFSIFDNLVEKHGLEKIKTIGDAYMAVGGLPDPLPHHAEAVADMALDMLEEISKIETAKEGWLRIRVGIHTGSAVAGVIGTKKFSYDLWGNTVNVASRMEHNSVAGNILVSDESYRRLRDKFMFIERGEVEVKGKGLMKTYFLIGRKSEPASALP